MVRKKSKGKRVKIDIDAILINSLIVLLILISVFAIFLVRDFVGYISYDAAKGGQITEVIIEEATPSTIWNGVYGIALQAPIFNTSWFVFANSDPNDVHELNPVFTCFEPGITHEVYATTLNSTSINWGNITAGTTEMVDDYVGVNYTDTQSATSTFNTTISVDIGATTINNIPAAYTQRYVDSNSKAFPVGILQDNGNIIMVAIINDDYLSAFRPDKIVNYQMMIPRPSNTSDLKYFFYTDPNDFCPQGEEGEVFEKGDVYGWVTDNATGAFLANALVWVEDEIAISNQSGFYNVTGVNPNTYPIVAIKAGFLNYVGNVTVYEHNSTLHNITMVLEEETLTGTGPGVGTGVDVGPGTDDPGTKTKSGEGPGIGPGVGPGIGPFIEKPEEFGKEYWISLDRLKKKLRLDNFFTEHILVFSFRQNPQNIHLQVTGNASEVLEILSDTNAIVEQNKYANFTVRGYGYREGLFIGKIEVTGDINDSLPVEISVVGADKLPVEALLMDLEVLTDRPLPGQNFRFLVNLQNLLIEENYDVRLDYYIRGVEAETANNTLYIGNDTISILTTHSLIKDVLIPPEWLRGDYFLIVEANYLDLYSRTSTVFELFEPIHKTKIFGLVELWKILLALSILALIIGIILYIRRRVESQKRFHAKVEYNLLPKKGPRSIYVGKIAETENDTYFDMDKLTVHTIVAGSTGGGKTISAQVIIEECLMKDTAVIVFDPTAQWSGMLRKCKDEKMMSYYPRFHLTKKDSRAFNGNVRAIKNPLEKIQLEKYWKPGEIQVFTVSTMTPKQIDIFVANTVRAVFKGNLQEFRGLRYMMVYDEVHRLLPKFGGSGEGFIQIERACREFRKWGIGVMLVSQVLADFVGQIKANINTEVQMKTRDEGDLKRIETKYGTSYVQELVKSPVGSGMVQNSSWNRGRPYYITFRPILHSVVRLADDELDKYNKYNEMVDDLSFQLDQLEELGKDVFDLRLELKLSLDKIKAGSFNMVEIYVEGLKPRIDKIWKELGKKPKKFVRELVSETEIQESINAAQQESEKAKAAGAEAGAGGEAKAKKLTVNDDVPPDKILNLVNGMLVIKLNALVDEIKSMKNTDFEKHVNADKNDFSDWIRDAYKNDKWADVADPILTKDDYIKFLELLAQGKEKEFKVVTPRPKPYSSKNKGVQQTAATPPAQAPAQPTTTTPPVQQPQKPAVQPVTQQQAKPVPPVIPTQPVQKPVAQPIQSTLQQPPPAKPAQPPVIEKPVTQAVQSQPTVQPKPVQQPVSQPAQPAQLTQQPPVQQPSPAIQPQAKPVSPTMPLQPNWQEINKYVEGKQPQEKIAYLKDMLNKYPGNENLLFTLAAAYHRINDLVNAEINYKKILEKNPENPKVLYYLGSVYNAQKKYKEALDTYNKVIKLQPDYPKVKQYIDSINKIIAQPKAQ